MLAALLIGMVLPLSTRAAAPSTLVIAYWGAPASIDPAISYDFAGPAILRNVYEGLVRLKGSSTTIVEGALATSWSANPQRTLWTFALRRGVVFHDGTPFNAQAVKVSIERMEAVNSSPSYIFGQFVQPADIEIVSPYTVRLHLHAPAPRLLYAFSSQYGSWMVSPTAIAQHRTAKDPWAQAWFGGHDAGTGPYTISQYVANQSATLSKFPQYWGGWGGHHVDRAIVSFVTEDVTRRSLLERGDADLTLNLMPQDLMALQKNAQITVDDRSIIGNWTLVPTESGPFASVQARQALSYAFDYNGFIQGLLRGFGQRARGPLAAYADGHDPSVFQYQTDMTKARQLFAAAGVHPGTHLTMWYPSSDPFQKDIALVTQAQLDSLGFVVDVVAKDSATYYNAYYGTEPVAQRPNLWVGNWSGDYNDAIAWFYPQYHTQTGSFGGSNAGLYHNKSADALMERAAVTVNLSARQALLNQIQTILTVQDPASVYVGDTTNSTAYRTAVHGYYYNTTYVFSYNIYAMWLS